MSAGISWGSGQIKRSALEDKLTVDMRKTKRKESNRESARRSRVRKQSYVDHLTAQVAQLRDENRQIQSRVDVTAQVYVHVDAGNSILRAQLAELANRLSSLDEIISSMNPEHSAEYFDRCLVAGEKILTVHDHHHDDAIMVNHNHIHHQYHNPSGPGACTSTNKSWTFSCDVMND